MFKHESLSVISFINNVSAQSTNTAKIYSKRLGTFQQFVLQTYPNLSIDYLLQNLLQGKIDVYNLFSQYIGYLQRKGTMSPISIKMYVLTAKILLEFFDVEISSIKWKRKVRMERPVLSKKESLTKEDIQHIISSCPSIKLKTYLLWLAATSCRASESLSVRMGDINFKVSPATCHLRGKQTKTKTSRTLLLTKELTEQLKAWIKYKYRVRSTGYYNHEKKCTENKVIRPVFRKDHLLFGPNWDINPTINSLYVSYLTSFEKLLDSLGGKYSEYEPDNNKRRRYTLHSFRRYGFGTISDLGFSDYALYYIGHKGSSYWTRSAEEIVNLFKKCEPYLTFLSYAALETKSNDLKTRNERLESEVIELRKNIHDISERLEELKPLAKMFVDRVNKEK